MPASTFPAPSLFVRPNGEADIAAESPDDMLWYHRATPGGPWPGAQAGYPPGGSCKLVAMVSRAPARQSSSPNDERRPS
jgi:hypothetical protein